MEFRQALRSLRNSMGLTITAALALALGVGVTTTMFSAVDQLLVRALPYPASDRLMMLYQHGDDRPTQSVMLGSSRIDDLHRAQTQRVFAAVSVYTGMSPVVIGLGDAARVNGVRVDSEFFHAMRVSPAIGRVPASDEYRTGAPVIVLSDALWRTRLGADRSVVGKRITLDTTSYQVIVVMPASFNFPMKAAFWVPTRGVAAPARCVQCAWAVGRLADGVTIDAARARMRALAASDREIDASLPPFMRSMYVDMTSIRDWTTREARTELLVLFAAVCCVLLIACANVANLLLSRSLARRREFAVRIALGASRARIIRQVLIEAAALAIPAALAGILLAEWGVRLLGVFIPRWSLVETITVDARVLAFALVASLAAAFVSALWPAVRASAVAPSPTLREAQHASGSMSRNRFRSAMVVIQVAMSFVLVTGAFLLTKSFLRLVSTDTGFQPQRLVAMTVQLSRALYSKSAQRVAFRTALEQRVRTLPGIGGFAVTTAVPFAGTGMLTEFANAADTSRLAFGPAVNTTEGLFGVLGTPMLAGRNFAPTDSGVVILNRTAASKLFPAGSAVGQRVTMFGQASTVIGIVGDMRSENRAEAPMPQLFAPLAGVPADYLLVVVRTTGDPTAVMSALRGIVHTIDARQPIERLATMDALLSDSVKQPRTQTVLLVVFGGLAFLMACLGLYGVVSYSVVQRTHEIGVRVALGAERASVVRLVLRQGVVLAAVGAAIGVVVALWATRFIAASLYEVRLLDPTVFVSTAAGLLGIAVLASLLPARRATRIDPMIALRAE